MGNYDRINLLFKILDTIILISDYQYTSPNLPKLDFFAPPEEQNGANGAKCDDVFFDYLHRLLIQNIHTENGYCKHNYLY